MVGNNSISGSSSAQFAVWVGLETLAIEYNPRLDWSLEMLGNWSSLKHAAMQVPAALKRAVLSACLQGCRIGGTLPQIVLPEGLEALLLSDNLVSGTLSTASFATASLETLTLSGGRCVQLEAPT